MSQNSHHSSTPLLPAEVWADIDWVLLDMDGTLLDLCFDDTFWQQQAPAAYARHHGIALGDAAAYIQQLAEDAYGTLNWYCLDFWSVQLGFDIRPDKSELKHLIGFRPGALAFLKWLKHQNKEVILATNAHPDNIALKDTQTDLCRWVNQVLHAHDAGAPKEHSKYWHWLHEQTQFNAQRALFIDDNDHILDSAVKAGVAHCIGVKTPNLGAPEKASRYPAFHHFQELYPASL